MTRPVVIVDYDPRWPGFYEQEHGRLARVVGHIVRRFAHVGSTAVPGLAAKPTVDIMAGVADAASAELCLASLGKIGYADVALQADGDDSWYYCLGKRACEGRAFRVHLAEFPSDFWDRHVLFRDLLRERADVARDYENLKRELAERFRDDRLSYNRAKAEFVERAVARASREKKRGE